MTIFLVHTCSLWLLYERYYSSITSIIPHCWNNNGNRRKNFVKLVHALHNIWFFSRKKHTILFLDSSSEVIIFQTARTKGQPLNFFVFVALFSRFSAIIRDESSNLIPVFLNSCFCFIFFLIYILMMTFHIFFLLFVKKCPGGECISVSDFFPLVFSSIGFPIEKNTRNFEVRKKLLLFFYYYLGQWNSFFFVTVFIWAVFFSLGFLFFFFRAKFECRSWKLQQRGNILCEFAIAKTTGRTLLPSTLCHRYELKKKTKKNH